MSHTWSRRVRATSSHHRFRRRLLAFAVAMSLAACALIVTAPSAFAATAVTGEIIGLGGKCLAAKGGAATSGTPVVMADCNGAVGQRWFDDGSGVLRLGDGSGPCLDVTGQSTADGALVEIWSCNGGTNQQWHPSGTALTAVGASKCLDVPQALATNGTQVEIWSCNGGGNQAWSLPNGQALQVAAISAQSGTAGVATGVEPHASGGSAPYQWSATGLPSGVSINGTDGYLQGAPTHVGSYNVTVTATDVAGTVASASFVWSIAVPSTAGTYYVDCSAASDGSGTQASPWNALADANGHTFAPGDSLLFKAGSTCTGQLTPRGNGTATAPITVGSYGTGPRPLIAGNGVAGSVFGSGTDTDGGGAVQLTNQSYWIIEDLEVTNTAATNAQRDGIEVIMTDGAEHDGITIRDNVVHGVSGYVDHNSNGFWLSHGIGVDSPIQGSFVRGLAIVDNYVHDTASQGVGIYGDQISNNDVNALQDRDVLVAGNTVERVQNDGIVATVSDSPLVEHNVADQVGVNVATSRNFAGIWGWDDRNPTFQFNEISHVAQAAYDGEAYDCDGFITGVCTYQNNYDHDNAGGMMLICTGCGGTEPTVVVMRNNVSVNDCRMVTTDGHMATFLAYNNTISCPNGTWNYVSADPVEEFVNNIFVGRAGSSLPSGLNYQSNSYVGFTPPTGDPHSSTADPAFVEPGADNYGITTLGGYQLRTGSPDLSAGQPVPDGAVDVPVLRGSDLWGNQAAAGSINRGAYLATGVGTSVRSDDTAASYTGAWVQASCSGCFGGTNHYTPNPTETGASVSLTATGSTISLYSSISPENRIASVAIDGGTPVEVDTYSPDTKTFGQLVFTSPKLTNGPHTVTISYLGKADPRNPDGVGIALDSWTVAP